MNSARVIGRVMVAWRYVGELSGREAVVKSETHFRIAGTSVRTLRAMYSMNATPSEPSSDPRVSSLMSDITHGMYVYNKKDRHRLGLRRELLFRFHTAWSPCEVAYAEGRLASLRILVQSVSR